MARFRVLYSDRGDYSHDFALEQPYYDANISIVDQQLAKAGVRLAKVLNDAFP